MTWPAAGGSKMELTVSPDGNASKLWLVDGAGVFTVRLEGPACHQNQKTAPAAARRITTIKRKRNFFIVPLPGFEPGLPG